MYYDGLAVDERMDSEVMTNFDCSGQRRQPAAEERNNNVLNRRSIARPRRHLCKRFGNTR